MRCWCTQDSIPLKKVVAACLENDLVVNVCDVHHPQHVQCEVVSAKHGKVNRAVRAGRDWEVRLPENTSHNVECDVGARVPHVRSYNKESRRWVLGGGGGGQFVVSTKFT